ncbi:PEP-CTERM sorting domain-containing protein [Simplicispira psychrophila]|uniref:Npun_F0296 family exosortase-dependent surface protein n=1 Tax=Simplicispira psychrophila TaxID=80882 RepID=UPI000A0393AD|nr:PEP-CTERM sorting domain-containing protein [Simplicispira psychrophila]
MTDSKKLLLGLALSSAALLSLPAQGMAISYGGQIAGDGSGLTSSFIPASNITLPGSGYFVETFDAASASLLAALPPDGVSIQAGCSVNASGALNITTTGGGFGVQSGSTSSAAAPANDTTCFGFGPQPGGGLPATVKVDYSSVLSSGVKVSYLGLYYGSIDTYNDIRIYDGATLLRTITGTEVLAASSGISGNQVAPGSNVYVNFAFAPDEAFTAFEFHTTSVAFEVDNIVVGLTNRRDVPEPGSLALLGAGLLGFTVIRRRQRKG